MRPYVPIGLRHALLVRACLVFFAYFFTSGCCNSGSSNDAPAPANATPTPSTPVLPAPVGPTNGPTVDDLGGIKAPPGAEIDMGSMPAQDRPTPGEREIAGAAQILITYKGAENAPKTVTRTKEDAKKRAEDVLKQLRADEKKFAELVKKYSDDAVSKPAEGRIGNFERNAMPAAFSDACFSMKVDSISDVVETPRGFHIIKRTK